MAATLACRDLLSVEDLVVGSGGGGTQASGVDVEETVKALSDMVNDLDREGSWRKAGIPCCKVLNVRRSGSSAQA